MRPITKTARAAVLALATASVSLTAAAPQSFAQEAPQAKPAAPAEDHAYLPPWMQPQANAASQGTMQSQYLNALDDPALKQKAQAQAQAQKAPRRRRSSGSGNPFSDFLW